MPEQPDYGSLLASLRVNEDWIPRALTAAQYRALCQKLKLFIPGFITERWQLHALVWDKSFSPRLNRMDKFGNSIGHYAALAGQIDTLDTIRLSKGDGLNHISHSGNTLAHYAAMSGKPEVLQWFHHHYPGLLLKKNHADCTIAHYAAWAGDLAMLEWIKINYPDQLNQKSKIGNPFAHSAALGGHTAVLQWIKTNNWAWLKETTKHGGTLAHSAAASPNPDTLLWVRANCPELMDKRDCLGHTIVHFALLSTHAQQVKLALTWVGNPSQLDLSTMGSKQLKEKQALTTLEQTLVTNYTLTHLILPQRMAIASRLETLMAENQAIKNVLKTFTYLCHAKNPVLSRMPRDMLFILFTETITPLSNRLSPALIQTLFDKLYNGSKPNRLEAALAVSKQITQLKRQLAPESFFMSCINTLRKRDTALIIKKIDALSALRDLILRAPHFTEKQWKQWYWTHADIINQTEINPLIHSLCRWFGFNALTILMPPRVDTHPAPTEPAH